MIDLYTMALVEIHRQFKTYHSKENAMCVAPQSNRLHPLHTPEILIDRIQCTGEYPDRLRGTGRTTILALEGLARAMRNPGYWQVITDHHSTECSHKHLRAMMQGMAEMMGLKHLHFRDREVCFGTPLVEKPGRYTERKCCQKYMETISYV